MTNELLKRVITKALDLSEGKPNAERAAIACDLIEFALGAEKPPVPESRATPVTILPNVVTAPYIEVVQENEPDEPIMAAVQPAGPVDMEGNDPGTPNEAVLAIRRPQAVSMPVDDSKGGPGQPLYWAKAQDLADYVVRNTPEFFTVKAGEVDVTFERAALPMDAAYMVRLEYRARNAPTNKVISTLKAAADPSGRVIGTVPVGNTTTTTASDIVSMYEPRPNMKESLAKIMREAQAIVAPRSGIVRSLPPTPQSWTTSDPSVPHSEV